MGEAQALDFLDLAGRLFAALVAGGLIGFERNFHARAAGVRTHALVAAGAALIMTSVERHSAWVTPMGELISLDPTRVIQGVMTGIGFLGAGVIFKTGLTVHGLTTAAAIWVTAAVGVLFGIGLYAVGALGTFIVLLVLTAFNVVESVLPARQVARLIIRSSTEQRLGGDALDDILRSEGLEVLNAKHELLDRGAVYEENLRVMSKKAIDSRSLADCLLRTDRVLEFEITPRGD